MLRLSKLLWGLVLVLSSVEAVAGGQLHTYDHDLLPASFFTGNRNRLRELMPDSSMAVIFSAPVRIRSNDVNFVYHQDPDFYYLSGFRDPDAVLFIFKDSILLPNGTWTRERIVVREREEKRELWTGRMATPGEVERISGIREVRVSTEPTALSVPFSNFTKVMLLRMPSGLSDDRDDSLELFDLVGTFVQASGFPSKNSDSESLESMLGVLRETKQPLEMTLLRKAVDISVQGHFRMMDSLQAGLKEYQVEAVGEYVFHDHGAEDVGYPSICGASENGCVLHYDKNRRTVQDGELILLDMGAEYHGYTADITRTLPVSGTFTDAQRQLYDLVWKAQQAGIDSCLAGNAFKAPHRAALKVIEEGLLELGIIEKSADARRYFPHSTSHYLGLDVHDPGSYGPLKPNQVITVEPGIYIPEDSDCDRKWWNIGIRIEDDILITEDAPVNLSGDLISRSVLLENRLKKGR